MSQGRKILNSGIVLTCLRAGLVPGLEMSQGPDLSQGRKCLKGRTCLKVHSRRCPGPEVSRGRKCLMNHKNFQNFQSFAIF